MENSSNTSENKPSFKVNFLSVLLALLIIVPLVYFLMTKDGNENTALDKTQSSIDALQAAKSAVNTNPNYDTYLNLSLQYYNSGMFEECIAASNKAITYNVNGDGAYNNIGAAYGALGKYNKEIEFCEKAVLINPNNQLAKNNIIWAKEQLQLTKTDSLQVKKN